MADLLYDAILGKEAPKSASTSETINPIGDEDLRHPNVQKALQYINAYEGKPKANQTFGYKEFNDLSKHPNIKIPFTDKGDTTTAAGTYQILAPTWETQAKKQGLKDFSPENQDKAAVGILRDTGALDALKSGDFDKAKKLMGTQWASIPGSTIGKSTGQIPKENTQHESILPSGDMLYNAIMGNDVSTGGAKTPTGTNIQSDVPQAIQNAPTKEAQMNWFQRNMNAPEASKKLIGAGEAAAALVANPVISTVGAVKGLVQSLPEIAGGKAPEIAAKIASQFEKEHGYSPTSEKGKEYLQSIGETFKGLVETATGSSMPLPPIVPEIAGITAGRTAAGQIERQFAQAKAGPKPSAKIYDFPSAQQEQTMAGVGAAQTNKASILQEAINRAQSPELKKELSKINPETINSEVLNRRIEADTLPVPIKLTEGQATQDPTLISFERNERGLKQPLTEHLNQQNKALMENASLMKDRVAPDVFTENHVADAQGLISKIEDKAKANAEATKSAYQDLKDAAGGQFPVDGKLFADNAINVLNKEDRFDYLPSNIQRKLVDYQSGKKEMNFNLFENLRTDLAAEIRKAQRAGDGNQAYVLGQVRGELEKLPMVGETAEIKVLADKARGLAKSDFDLEAQNKLYSDVVNGKADTKSFISKNIVNAPNKDFANTMALVADDPIAKQHLASGTLDLIIKDSTDASGNFNTAKFAKHIDNLQVNGKLLPLFGEEAKTLQQIANTGKLIESRPRGAFVNESNTLTGALGQYAKGAVEHGTNIAFKGLPVGTIGRTLLAKRTMKKQLEKTLSPTGGVQLKDIGK